MDSPSSQSSPRPSGAPNPLNRRVLALSALAILVLSAFGVMGAETATVVFSEVQRWIVGNLGWFYVLAVSGFLVFTVVLAVSQYGDVRLGPDGSEPEYSYASWFAMLFSAGMGIGLMFFGVAEPVTH